MEQQVRVNNRKSLSGRVVSTKNTKTIIVAVDIYIKHPLYGKRFLFMGYNKAGLFRPFLENVFYEINSTR